MNANTVCDSKNHRKTLEGYTPNFYEWLHPGWRVALKDRKSEDTKIF